MLKFCKNGGVTAFLGINRTFAMPKKDLGHVWQGVRPVVMGAKFII